MCSITICKDIHQVAKSILIHSFAIYEIDHEIIDTTTTTTTTTNNNELYTSISNAWIASYNFLSFIHDNTVTTTQCSNTKKDCNSSKYIDVGDNKKAKEYNDNSHDDIKTMTKEEKEMYYIQKYRNVHNGKLYGYNRPSDAKLLFRVFYNHYNQIKYIKSSDDTCKKFIKNYQNEDEGTTHHDQYSYHQQLQPWPDDFDQGYLKKWSNDVSLKLHRLLLECVDEIQTIITDTAGKVIENKDMSLLPLVTTISSLPSKSIQQEPLCPKKRKRMNDHDQRYELHHHHHSSLSSSLLFKNCPLDYFYYHNNTNDKVRNCSEHVDRGVLICVVLSNNVEGLEVLSNETQEWICPERLIMELSSSKTKATTTTSSSSCKNACSQFICIMSGDQLRHVVKDVIKEEEEDDDDDKNEEIHYPFLSPCIHRVKKLDRDRLSISYELRL